MAAIEVMVLSSSPPRSLASPAASPALPSPSHLLLRPQHRTHATKTSVPPDADCVINASASPRKAPAKRKHGFVADVVAESEAMVIESRKSSGDILPKCSRESSGCQTIDGSKHDITKGKGSKAKQDAGQTKIQRGKVTKALVAKTDRSQKVDSDKANKRSKTSASCGDPKLGKPETEHGLPISKDLCLEEALKRKASWTPPKDTVRDTVTVLDLSEMAGSGSGGTTESHPNGAGSEFGDICRAFGFNGKGPVPAGSNSPLVSNPIARTKKARAKLDGRTVTKPTVSDGTENPKPKAKQPKKKAKTITEQATAPYALEHTQSSTASLLQYFSGANLADDLENSDGTTAGALCHPRRSPTKQKATRRKPKKGDPHQEAALLSPRAACDQINSQNFLFGTSSQLAREKSGSPTRNLLETMNASKCSNGQSVTWSESDRGRDGKLSGFMASRGLWSRAAADAGDSVPSEVLKESEDRARDEAGASDSAALPPPVVNTTQKEKELNDATATKLAKPNFEGYPTAQLAKELASYGFKPIKNRKRMIALIEKCWEGKQRVALKTLESNTHLSTAEQSSAQSSKNAERHRDSSKIELAPHEPCSGDVNGNTAATTRRSRTKPKGMAAVTASPNRHKGSGPRSISKEYTVPESPVSECNSSASMDKETYSPLPGSPSPSHLTRRRPHSTPSDVGLSPSSPGADRSNLTLDDSTLQAHRFSCITKAIQSEKPSTLPTAPSWHEKILMYDPIVLEDLAVWLNTHGLGAIGIDFEVAPAEVKAWCLERGICCLWRENLRGGVRKRR